MAVKKVVKKAAKKAEKRVIIRSSSAGVFFGKLVSLKGNVADLRNSRRIWRWEGAASLSQLAVDGTCKPEGCKFPVAIPVHKVLDVIEVIECTPQACASIDAVPIWKA